MWWRQVESQCSWWTFPAARKFSVGYLAKLYPLSKLKFVSVSNKNKKKKGKLSVWGFAIQSLFQMTNFTFKKLVGGVSNGRWSESLSSKTMFSSLISYPISYRTDTEHFFSSTRTKLSFSVWKSFVCGQRKLTVYYLFRFDDWEILYCLW